MFLHRSGDLTVWRFQQGRIERLKLRLEEEKLQIDKNNQVVEMFEKLSKLLAEQRQLYDSFTALVQKGHTVGSFDFQQKLQQMDEKDQEIENVKKIISNLTGKEIEYVKGKLPPLPPSGLGIVG